MAVKMAGKWREINGGKNGKKNGGKYRRKSDKKYNSTDPVMVILKSSINIGKVVFAKATLAQLYKIYSTSGLVCLGYLWWCGTYKNYNVMTRPRRVSPGQTTAYRTKPGLSCLL